MSRNSSNNAFEKYFTPAPKLIPVQKRINNELEGEHNNSLINHDYATDKPKLVHNV